MNYFAELRAAWRPLLAATLGLGVGFSATMYITSAIAPDLIASQGWTPGDFAKVGSLSIFTALAIPFAGRLADVLGVKRTALIGMIALPLIYFAYSMIGASIGHYIAIFIVQATLCVTTTATVYSRLAVQYFERMRGLSLAVVASGPAIVGAALSPALNAYVDAEGWRAAFQAVALFTAVTGAIVFLLIPGEKASAKIGEELDAIYRRDKAHEPPVAQAHGTVRTKRRARDDYPLIFRTPAFWLLAGSMLLVNLPQVVALTQLRLVLEAQGVTAEAIGLLFSAFAMGVLIGRFVAGIALDRFPAHLVAFFSMAIPATGLFILASEVDTVPVLAAAVFGIGFTFGAEGDVVAYLVSRRFPVAIYSSVMGLMTMAMATSASVGAYSLGLILDATGGYETFLWISAGAVFAGSLLFLPLGRMKPLQGTPREEQAGIARA